MPSPKKGELIAGCRLLEKLGQGAYGVVWRAEQECMQTLCALKLIEPSNKLVRKLGLDNQQRLDAWKQYFLEKEAQAQAKLGDIPNAVTIYDAGEDTDTGSLFIRMEYMDKGNIGNEIQGGGMNPDKAVDIAREVLKGLRDIHEAGWVYGDLKPENILRNSKGEIKIGDLGLSVKRNPNAMHILPGHSGEYAAPELLETAAQVNRAQEEKRPIRQEELAGFDERADIYSAGVVLHQMVTGKLPDDMSIIGEKPSPRKLNKRVSRKLEKVIVKALSPFPDDRFQSAKEMLEALPKPPGGVIKKIAISLVAFIVLAFGGLFGYFNVTRDATSVPELIQMGNEEFKKQQYAEAAEYFKSAYEKDKRNAEARFWYGLSDFQIGLEESNSDKVNAGFKLMEEAIEFISLPQEKIVYHKRIAVLYERIANEWTDAKKWADAARHWEKVLDVDKNDMEAQVGLERAQKKGQNPW